MVIYGECRHLFQIRPDSMSQRETTGTALFCATMECEVIYTLTFQELFNIESINAVRIHGCANYIVVHLMLLLGHFKLNMELILAALGFFILFIQFSTNNK